MQSYKDKYVNDNRSDLDRYIESLRFNKISGIMRKNKHEYILDIGCGILPHVEFIDDCKRVILIESDIELAAHIMSFEKVIFFPYRFEDCYMMLDDKSDMVILSSLLHLVEDVDFFMEKLYNVCSYDATIIAAVNNMFSMHKFLGSAMGIDMVNDLSEKDKEFGHKRLFNKLSLKNLFEKHKFLCKSVHTFMIKPFDEDKMELIGNKKLFDGLNMLSGMYPESGCEIILEAKK